MFVLLIPQYGTLSDSSDTFVGKSEEALVFLLYFG